MKKMHRYSNSVDHLSLIYSRSDTLFQASFSANNIASTISCQMKILYFYVRLLLKKSLVQ
jgi:hypothetical protein